MARTGGDDLTAEAGQQLYAGPPDEFMAARTELAKAAHAAGDAAGAAAIEKLRKPTVAAWIVNALVIDDPSAVERLTGLGDRMRAAQERLDAAELRDLTAERRRLVDELTRAAFGRAGQRRPAAGLRDEVSATFDAAIADPQIAGRLGRLVRAERWSGFGFLPAGAPQLTVVRGGKGAGRKDAAAGKAGAASQAEPNADPERAAPRKTAAERRKERKAVSDAQQALEVAERSFDQAQVDERELGQRIKQLTRRLAKLQEELDGARDALESARKEVGAAKIRRREARSALDRAERAARD